MAKRYTPKDIEAIIQELIADNDRAKAIVGGGLLDAALDYAITTVIRPLEKPEENRLFSDSGPFIGCDQKIQTGYALGLYGSKTKRDMELVNKIRNIFAHDMNPVSFDDPEVSSRCRDLMTGSNGDSHDEGSWRTKFVLAVQLLVDGLLLDAVEPERKQLTLTSKHLSD